MSGAAVIMYLPNVDPVQNHLPDDEH